MKDASSAQDKQIRGQAGEVLSGRGKKGLKRLLPFMGPAFIASVAYIDPGNYATNISSGAKFGYMLLWVVLLSNLMAMLIQALSAKLGIATGHNLAEQCRLNFSKPVVYFMWGLMEIAAMATDLAEFLGAALGFNLLFGIPLWLAGLLTAAATFIILGLERYGFRPLEAVISAMVGIVAVCYVVETFLDKPVWKDVLYHAVVPQFQGPESIILATGIIGATIMPHAIYLHSALTQGRIIVRNPAQMKRLFRFEIYDVLIAMAAASLINSAMLVMSASAFHLQGLNNIGTIQEAYRTLQPLLGPAAGTIFAISLLASGLSSASVGTMAGQVIMQGFLHREIPVWVRRLVTMIPSLIVILLGLDPTRTLVLSQVGLSFGLPFAIIPLVMFTSRRELMGELTNRKLTTILAGLISCLIVVLNIYLIYTVFSSGG
jgi:manganese transport protein